MKNIAIFASGAGSNAIAIAKHFENSAIARVALVISNREGAGVHALMQPLGIPTFTFKGKEHWSADPEAGAEVLKLLKSYGIDAIALAGFLAYVPQKLLDAFKGKIVNIHPSLLPLYGGKGMYGLNVHKAVIDAGDKESGITIHEVSEDVDGGKILFQATCPVLPTDTPEILQERVHELEHKHFPLVIEALLK